MYEYFVEGFSLMVFADVTLTHLPFFHSAIKSAVSGNWGGNQNSQEKGFENTFFRIYSNKFISSLLQCTAWMRC